MSTLNILVYGKHADILATVLRLVNKEEAWNGQGSTVEAEVVELFREGNYDLVLFGGGVTEAEEQRLRALFLSQNPRVKLVQHYGGGSGLLKAEIEEALKDVKPKAV